jgi:AcrR family transcriptional regulator
MATAKRKSSSASEKWALPVQQARSRATRERILSAAERVFAEKGYAGAKLSDIAEVAGCSVGAVYFRFKDKDALFFAIAESFTEESRARLSQYVAGGSDPAPDGVVRDFVLRTAGNLRRHRGLFRAIIECGFDHPAVLGTVFAFREEVAEALDRTLHARLAIAPSKKLSAAVRIATQMVYGFLLVGILNPRAPTRLTDAATLAGLADATSAYLKTVYP